MRWPLSSPVIHSGDNLLWGNAEMDFGIDRVIEMFETRFGKGASYTLLALVGLAAAGLSIQIIISTILLPAAGVASFVWEWAQGLPIPTPSNAELIAWASSAAFSLVLVIAVRKFMRGVLESRTRTIAAMERIVAQAEANLREVELVKRQVEELNRKKKREIPPEGDS